MTNKNREYKKDLTNWVNEVIRSYKDEKEVLSDLQRRVKHHKKRIKTYFEPAIRNGKRQIAAIK